MTAAVISSNAVRFFVNGQAMSGGALYGPLARSGQFLGAVRTAARYRFWACRGEFPALVSADLDGWCVPGELYRIGYDVLREQILPSEPEELELSVVELDDGTGALGMRIRAGVTPVELPMVEIEPGTGWRQHLELATRETMLPKQGR
jgi:hypothetical protein